jgi:hypothetical protein
MMLEKSGEGKVSFGYYQELLFRKLEREEEAVIRSTEFQGIKVGKIKSVGFDRFQIQEEDGEISSIRIDSILDIS